MKSLRFIFLALLLSLSANTWAENFPITITDVAGRVVTIEHKPKYIALSTGLVFPLLTLLYQKKTLDHLVAWRNDMKTNAPSMYRFYLRQFPRLSTIPEIGQIKSGSFNLARFLAIRPRPSIFLMDISDIRPAKADGILHLLKKDRVTVIAVDFRHDPIKNTVKSVMTVATALGRRKQGEAFVDYYKTHLAKIMSDLPHLLPKDRPRVFLERDAGYQTGIYRTFGNGNMGAFLSLLKAHNIAVPMLHGLFTGSVSPESIILANPTVYIMQSAGWISPKGQVFGGIPLGYNASPPDIKKADEHLMARMWFPALSAYQHHRMYSIYMPLYNSPYNLTAIAFFAKWLYPHRFKWLHPNQSFIQMNQLFAHERVSGVFGLNNTKALK